MKSVTHIYGKTVPAFPSQWSLFALAGAIALAYGMGTMLGFALTLGSSPVAVLWPANVILLAGLLLTPARGWWLVLVLVGLVHVIAQGIAGVTLTMSCCWLFSNALEALLGAILVRSFVREIGLVSLRNLFLIIAGAAVIAPLLVSFVDVALVQLMHWGEHSFWELWRRRFLSNIAATMVFLPVLLTWDRRLLARAHQAPVAKWLEGALLISTMAALAAMLLASGSARADRSTLYLYAVLPCILWAALRFPPFVASLGLPVFGLLAVLRLANSGAVENHEVIATQILIIAASAPMLTLLALRQEMLAMVLRGWQSGPQTRPQAGPHAGAHAGRQAVLSLLEQTQQAPHEPSSQEPLRPRQQENIEHLSRIAVLGKLSAALAHELNQPLAAILSNAQAARRFLGKQPVDLQEIGEILDDIVNEDRRAGEVIHRLRELFVKGGLKLQILHLNEVVLEVIELTRADLIERQIDFALHLSPDNPEVWGDRVQLQQVLLNFVMNAREAIRSCDDQGGRLEIFTGGSKEYVNVTVSDNGPGIAPHLLERVFDAFFTTKKHGMGFGLSISSTIVHQHGGHINVVNKREGGACFTVVLPRHKEVRKEF
jgi:signal transduction histidine kinase